ncbi:hypothetical protein [Caldivirga maquilingensis]|uniref:Uncharacterized protein n=1 Tax=Caldivirga maquilingensis (strain ATCC 700844 / DSM 13496 / JCM 10307 / IC-167) TaxID=397948 RepID=A8MBQ5_CALMQ|nr:hypothetical protein [Caldivirga maquilingensis]ABW01248.1 conserved hypothetical protein [Caldivirga maquilingensis IC-167]
MVEEVTVEELINRVMEGNNLEIIDYRGDLIVVDSVKGIVKGDVGDLGELKKRRPRGGPTKRQVELIAAIVRALVKSRVKFKVVFGPREATVRFDEDRYVRVTESDSRVVGFNSSSEEPLSIIYGELSGYGKVLFLKPLK